MSYASYKYEKNRFMNWDKEDFIKYIKILENFVIHDEYIGKRYHEINNEVIKKI